MTKDTLPNVIVTRELIGAQKTSSRLIKLGFNVIICPAIKLKALALPMTLPEANALIFTSANGVRFAPKDYKLSTTTCFCVGDATANAALRAGFQNVTSAQGNAAALTALIKNNWSTERGPLLHIGHESPRGNIVANLENIGLNAAHLPVYTTKIRKTFKTELIELLKSEKKAVKLLVFSPLAARAIDEAIGEYQPNSMPNTSVFLAISPDTRNALTNLSDSRVRTAPKPNENSLLALLHLS